MNINPGELNKKIQLLKPEITTNGNGIQQTEWIPVRNCWAKFTKTSGTELVKANAEFAEEKARFLVRYSSIPIDTNMIVRYAGEDYDIKYTNPYGDSHEYVELWTERREKV